MSVDTNTNAVDTAAAAAVQPAKAPSKMELSRPIFNEVTASDFVLPEGKTARAEFIRRAQEEAGCTPAGAATYWQNLSNEAKGGKLYSRPAKKATPPADEPKAEEPAGDDEPKADAEAEAEAEGDEPKVDDAPAS